MTGRDGSAEATGMDPNSEDVISLLGLMNVLLSGRRTIVALSLVVALVTAAYSLIVAPTYTATTTFLPELKASRQLPAGLSGLANQFGVTVGTGGAPSGRLDARILESRGLLERVLQSAFETNGLLEDRHDSASLIDIMQIEKDDPAQALEQGVRHLSRWVNVQVDDRTNIVRVAVDAPDPKLAADVANRLVSFLIEFNMGIRQSQARNQREFVEARVTEAEVELRDVEEDLRVFYERNRSWERSPQLVFEEGRLRRRVDILQEVYLTLRREYETARIEEVNDIKAITVIDRAIPPQRKSKPRRSLLVIGAAFVAAFWGAIWVLATRYVDWLRRGRSQDFEEFSRHLKQIRREFGGGILDPMLGRFGRARKRAASDPRP